MTSFYRSWVTRRTTDHQVNSLLSIGAAAGDSIGEEEAFGGGI